MAEESAEGIADAELDDVMDDALEMEMEKEPPSPSSPVSPTFSIGDKSPTPPASPTGPRESGSLLEKLILSTERRRSRELALEAVEAKAERGAGAGLRFPVLDFQSFKAGMDRTHGVLCRGTGSNGAGKEGVVATGGREGGALFEEAESMDVDSWVPPSRMGTGWTSEPMVGVIGDGRVGGEKGGEGLEVERWGVDVEMVEVVEAGGKFIKVLRLDTGTVGAPRSSRRGAWDWRIGGLGTAMAFADVGVDF